MADEHRAEERSERSKQELEHEIARAREHLADNAVQLRQALSQSVSPRYQLAQHPRLAVGVVAAAGLFVAWLWSDMRRRSREREVLRAIVRERERRGLGLSWWQRLRDG